MHTVICTLYFYSVIDKNLSLEVIRDSRHPRSLSGSCEWHSTQYPNGTLEETDSIVNFSACLDLYGDILGLTYKTVALADGEVSLKTVAQSWRKDCDRAVASVVEVAQHERPSSSTTYKRLDARVTCRSPCQPSLPHQHVPHASGNYLFMFRTNHGSVKLDFLRQ